MAVNKRPKFLNLSEIRLPVPGFVSILHRISGFGMFVFAWAILWLLQLSLQSPQTFEAVQGFARGWVGKLFLTGIGWAFLHHFFAGIRFLLLDMHIGTDLASARRNSWAVLALSVIGVVILGVCVW